MAYSKPTLADLKQSLADRHDSGVLPTASATLALWTRHFNRGIKYCSDRLRTNSATTLTTSGGTVTCPTAFLTVNTVYDSDNVPVGQISQELASVATGKVFWIAGDFKTGYTFNVPSENDGTYTVNLSQKPDPLVSDSDICDIPDEEAVVAYAYCFLRKSETDPIGDADAAMDECDSRLDQIIDAQNSNDAFTGFTFIE